MPDQTPTRGETWEMRDNLGRSTRGIVAEVTQNIITLVALTGARIKVPASRLPQQWVFVASPPKTTLLCNRCKDPGILRYQRGTSPDFVCAKHAPVGVILSMHTPGEPVAERAPAPKNIIVCPHCGNADPVEDDRLGRLEQGQFGWWTCTLCSSRWGLIAEPAADTDNRGRWYGAALADLYQTMLEHNADMTRIDLSRSAWIALAGAYRRNEVPLMLVNENVNPDSGFAVGSMFEVPLHMVASLSDGSVLVRAPNAPAGSAIAPSRRPVQKIGGIGNRSWADEPLPSRPPVLLDRHVAIEQRRQIVASLPPREAPVRVHSIQGTPVPLAPMSIMNVAVKKPREGDRYFQRRTGNAVTIERVEDSDNGWSVAIRQDSYTGNTVGQSPFILWMNDFLQDFVPFAESMHSAPPPIVPSNVVLAIDEEWYSYEFNEYVRILSTDYRSMIAVVRGGSTGKTRNIHVDDFAVESKFKKIVRTTVHQRLMGDDDY
jgi:hypothetical protein